jgi:predicted ATPase/transcriptional regulator with XRE-family HTH domain
VQAVPSTPALLGFGSLLKRMRRAAHLTQEELAQRLGFSVVYVSMLERGARHPRPTTVALLTDALSLAPTERAILEAAAQQDSASNIGIEQAVTKANMQISALGSEVKNAAQEDNSSYKTDEDKTDEEVALDTVDLKRQRELQRQARETIARIVNPPGSFDPLVAGPDALSARASKGPRHWNVGARPLSSSAGFFGALPSTRMIGRERELAVFVDALATVASGQGRLLVLTGEPGVGKTRLAQEITLRARAAGFRVLTGRCYESQQTLAYAPFLEVLTQAVPLADTASQPLASQWPEVARLLRDLPPDQRVSASAPALRNGGSAQQRLFWQVSDFLGTLAAQAPLAVLLDDLHWADLASLDLLQHLARHTRERAILLVGTARAIDALRQYPLADTLRDLRRDELVERIVLPPLKAADTAELIGASLGGATGAVGSASEVSAEVAQSIYARSEGNPFFARQLTRALQEQDALAFEAGQWRLTPSSDAARAMPESIMAVIRQRLRRLTPLTQEVLHEASVLGPVVVVEELRRVGGRGEQEVEAALEEALGAGIVRDEEQDRYHFNHTLTRETLYVDIPARRRRRLHQAAAETIEQMPDHARRAAEVGSHFLAAGARQRALPYIMLAGDQAESVHAHAEAERFYRSAVEVARDGADLVQEASALEKLGDLLFALAQYAEALEAHGAATQIYRALGDDEGMSRITAQSSLELAYTASPEQGKVLIQQLVDTQTPKESSSSLANLYLSLALLSTDPMERLAASERASAIAESIGDTNTYTEAELVRGNTLLGQLGRIDEAHRILKQLIPLLESSSNRGSLCTVCNLLAEVSLRSGALDTAREYADRALEVATEVGMPAQVAWTYCHHGEIAYHAGDWSQAYHDFDDGENMYQRIGIVHESSNAIGGKGRVLLARGEIEGAARLLEEAIWRAETGHDGELQGLKDAHAALAERDLVAGSSAAARARIEPLIERFQGWPSLVVQLLPLLAWASVEQADFDRADSLIAEAITGASKGSQPLLLMDVLRVKGMSSARRQQWGDANTELEEALRMSKAMLTPYAEAKILFALGRLELAREETRGARTYLEAALGMCARLGEGLYRQQVQHTLVALSRL